MNETTGRRSAIRQAVGKAILAPSVHNTQPWRFFVDGDRIDIVADTSRQLQVLDRDGRELAIACGAALFNIRVELASLGYDIEVLRYPDPANPTLVASVEIRGFAETPSRIARLDALIELRRTNRRPFAPEPVPEDFVWELVEAATQEQVDAIPIVRTDQQLAIARLSQAADRIEMNEHDYLTELRAWTTTDAARLDGVHAAAMPHAHAGPHDDVPIRNFDTREEGQLPAHPHSSRKQCMLVFATVSDTPESWLRTGEAMQHVWLEITRNGYAAGPLTQVTEIPYTRESLRRELGLDVHPQVVLRVGRAAPAPPSPRRPLSEVLVERTAACR